MVHIQATNSFAQNFPERKKFGNKEKLQPWSTLLINIKIFYKKQALKLIVLLVYFHMPNKICQ